MGFRFMDLFIPKYNNKDPEVRKEAIRTMKNTELLAMMAERDADQGVRDAASGRLAELEASQKVASAA